VSAVLDDDDDFTEQRPTDPKTDYFISISLFQPLSMFRVSPWISYEPAESKPHHGSPSDPIKSKPSTSNMDEDIDMDAPQISILRDEESPPPPPPTRTSKFRVKLLVNDAKPVPGSPGSTSRKPSTGPRDDPPLLGEDDDDEDEEEDQLMDDENPINPSTLPKRRPSSKRKPRRNDKRAAAEDEKKARQLPPGRSIGRS
jgi:Wiskott-Aldrich syndrome protein